MAFVIFMWVVQHRTGAGIHIMPCETIFLVDRYGHFAYEKSIMDLLLCRRRKDGLLGRYYRYYRLRALLSQSPRLDHKAIIWFLLNIVASIFPEFVASGAQFPFLYFMTFFTGAARAWQPCQPRF
jgi:hypothetical protein